VLRREIDAAGEILNRSRDSLAFAPALLRDALDVGLELSGARPLERIPATRSSPTYRVPDLSESWDRTLDTLRPPRARDESFWDWRKRSPLPVVFDPPEGMDTSVAHLHLQHPLVQRILSRFLAQGYSAHDLHRVTVVRTERDSLVRAIAFGRLSLFGPGATRLHDEVLSVAAPWLEGGGARHLKPFADEADRKALDTLDEVLESGPDLAVSAKVEERLLASAGSDFATLWPHLQDEADARAHAAGQKLAARASAEAEALRQLLEAQRQAILDVLRGQQQEVFDFREADRDQLRQLEDDRRHMEHRLLAIDQELWTEPAQIDELYRVVLRRLEPVGLIYLWPATRG
jgi:hypothetical protein